MISIPILDLKAQYTSIKEEIQIAIERVLESQQFILGPEVEALEVELAAYCGCKYAIGVSSGTDAILLALMTLGIGSGDEVITTPYSFFATAGSIVRLGAHPVFMDVDLDTLNINASLIEAKITPKTRAILPVHLAGQMAEMGPIMDLAERYHLHVIEDACQAIGADYQGKRAGSMGDFGCFSFFPSKNLGGYGDSGLLTTSDPDLADRARLLRNHGHRPKYYNQAIGGNFRMDALQAAVLRAKFPHLEEWTAARQRHATLYRELFIKAGLASEIETQRSTMPVILPKEAGWGRHIYHLFQVRVRERDRLLHHLKENGIGSEIYYPVSLHLQACFAGMGYALGDCPSAERLANETLALPIYPELSAGQIDRVVSSINSFYN